MDDIVQLKHRLEEIIAEHLREFRQKNVYQRSVHLTTDSFVRIQQSTHEKIHNLALPLEILIANQSCNQEDSMSTNQDGRISHTASKNVSVAADSCSTAKNSGCENGMDEKDLTLCKCRPLS